MGTTEVKQQNQNFTGTKKWYQSKTVWSAIVAGIAILVSLFTGKKISAETQKAMTDNIIQLVSAAVGLAGCIGVIIGRKKANKRIE